MPIYEYECTGCHHTFDLLQKLNEESTKQCPECLKDTAVRLVSAAGFQLKGTGWYATDFKDKGKAPQKTEGSASDSPSKDTKPAEKTVTESTATSSSATTKGEAD